MTSELKTYERAFDLHRAQLRLLKVDDDIWFKGGDVAAALGYRKARNAIDRHVDEEDKTCLCALRTVSNGESDGDTGDLDDATIFINESGLYALVLRSKLPCAKAFTRWVTSEVLPDIRRTGAYTRPPNSTWLDRAARIQAVGAACGAANALGMELGEPHRQAAVAAINELLVTPEHDLHDLVDAAEYLRRRGHSDAEVRRLSSEFGRALKAARPARSRVHIIADFGPDTHFLHKYHVRDDALFLDAVYAVFRERELFGRVAERHGARSEQMLAEVTGALVGSRGCCDRPAKRRR
jgi:prophage antirepressor-like protein